MPNIVDYTTQQPTLSTTGRKIVDYTTQQPSGTFSDLPNAEAATGDASAMQGMNLQNSIQPVDYTTMPSQGQQQAVVPNVVDYTTQPSSIPAQSGNFVNYSAQMANAQPMSSQPVAEAATGSITDASGQVANSGYTASQPNQSTNLSMMPSSGSEAGLAANGIMTAGGLLTSNNGGVQPNQAADTSDGKSPLTEAQTSSLGSAAAVAGVAGAVTVGSIYAGRRWGQPKQTKENIEASKKQQMDSQQQIPKSTASSGKMTTWLKKFLSHGK